MADNTLDQIVDYIRNSGCSNFPGHSEVNAVRVVGHTPKTNHNIHEIVVEFSHGWQRINAKIYRGKTAGLAPHELAKKEAQNLQFAHEAAERNGLRGIPRPIGDFAGLGAVVSTKVNGLPLQSIIMKVALLPDPGNHPLMEMAARQAGEWLQEFHQATATAADPFDGDTAFAEMTNLCARAQKDGLPTESTTAILGRAESVFTSQKRPLAASAVLQDFVPLNLLVAEEGVGFCEFASLRQRGHSLYDVAVFLASIEALEKYPFCNRTMTAMLQDAFVQAYGVSAAEQALLDTLKMKVLLQMFAQGRVIKESGQRKKVMWANVMKRFIQQAAERSAGRAA